MAERDKVRELAARITERLSVYPGDTDLAERILLADLKTLLELSELVLKLQHEQQKWLTAGGRNAMKPAFALAAELKGWRKD